MEVFQQETSNAVMTAMLIYDLNSSSSVANPDRKLQNPLCLFAEGSFHGGPWRIAHKFNSIGVISALLYFVSLLVNMYLLAYNFVQTAGWCFCFFKLITAIQGNADVWTESGAAFSQFQFLSLMEVVHALVGVTSSSFLTVLNQIASRILVIGVVNCHPLQPDMANGQNFSLCMMLTAWCLAEIFRYGYFVCKFADLELFVLTWLRYSLFLVLYPVGVAGEVLTLYQTLPTLAGAIGAVDLATTTDPTTVLFTNCARLVGSLTEVEFAVFVEYLLFPVYFFGLSFMYTHMLGQRKRVLSRRK